MHVLGNETGTNFKPFMTVVDHAAEVGRWSRLQLRKLTMSSTVKPIPRSVAHSWAIKKFVRLPRQSHD